jgi:hypothetical protein
MLGLLLLLGVVVGRAGAATLLIEHDVSISSAEIQSDRFTWTDASGEPRKAALSQNRGGAMVEYQYQVGGTPRIVGVTDANEAAFGGFGYVVSHPTDAAVCTPGPHDSSSLGFGTPGTFQRVFEGRHHAIFRFTQNYPRYCTKTGPAADHVIPVTIDWVISTGRDNPLWAVTWDMSAIAADVLEDDSRGPYGELLFDGSTTSGTHSTIAGVAWGERYKFESTTNPVTYNSAWNWLELNSVPYVKLFTTEVDATMGTVQTQTMSQQDAGGYFGVGAWTFSSATLPGGNACTVATGGVDTVMPCNFNWPFQSINYSLDPGAPNDSTRSTRLAWGTNFGFLGQTTYPVMGSADPAIGGPVGNGVDPNYGNESAYASGHPRRSYSTFVVLGLHSLLPVEAQRSQIENVQGTVVTATTGTVVTSGPAGVNRTDTVTYAPAGWNHVYGAWAVQAGAGNKVDVNINAGGLTLTNPLIIVSGWASPDLPGAVRLNGVPLTQDTGYYPSVRGSAQELWVTLNQSLVGAVNRLEIIGQTFADVPASYWASSYIEALYRAGVTGGCSTNPLNYCPDNSVTREQMAVFLLKGALGSGYTPPACTTPTFADVPCSSIFAPWIEDLVNRGITIGCGGGLFCPSDPVTREQMAVFLLRSVGVLSDTLAACTPPGPFSDVPCSSVYSRWIQELVARAITFGCTATTYCPTSQVTRAQMAVFLVKTFALPYP